MPTRPLTATRTETREPAATSDEARGMHPAASGVASGLLLWFAFPPADWGWLAWVALVPLFLLVRSDQAPWKVYLGAWAGGWVFWVLSVQWIRLTDPSAWTAWLVAAAILSLWWPGFLALARLGVRRLKLPMIVAAPVVWVGLEYFRTIPIGGFPWYYLAHSQYRALPLIQVADLVGAWGVSLLVAAVNAWVVDLLTLPLLQQTPRGARLARPQAVRLAVMMAALGGTLIYGVARLGTSSFREGPRVALLQSNFRQDLKMGLKSREILAAFQRLVALALRAPDRPDLIVWPETSFPYWVSRIDPAIPPEVLARQLAEVEPDLPAAEFRARALDVVDGLHAMVDRSGVAMLIGATTADFRPEGRVRANAALLFVPGERRVQEYAKVHLVPFGEYVPLIETFPWLWRLTPYDQAHLPSLAPGPGPSWFVLDGFKFAAAICFEDTVPTVARRSFAESEGGPPDLLLNLSNDGWFAGSSELDVHLAISVFRAVENRVPLGRSVNTGLSSLIDGDGRILAALPKGREDVLAVTIPLDDRRSLYTTLGDWLPLACLAMTIGLVPLGLRSARLGRPDRVARLPRLPKAR